MWRQPNHVAWMHHSILLGLRMEKVESLFCARTSMTPNLDQADRLCDIQTERTSSSIPFLSRRAGG